MSRPKKEEGHRLCMYIKHEDLGPLRKMLAICNYYKAKGDPKKQALSYWIREMMKMYVDVMFKNVQKEEDVEFEWIEQGLKIYEKEPYIIEFVSKRYPPETDEEMFLKDTLGQRRERMKRIEKAREKRENM